MRDSTNEHKLTTWEAYNYILRGLVNEAIEVFKLDPEVKLTALQIWSSYLRRNEAAFFNDEEEVLPKLPACFKKHDFNLLKKRKRKHSETNEEGDPHFTKFDLQIAKIDKKMLKVDQEMALSQSLVLKRIDRKELAKRYDKQRLSRSVLFIILFCAINYHHPSMVQTSDILRMIREGRLSYFRCRHLLPSDLSESEKTYIHKMYVKYPAYMSISQFNKSIHQFTFFCNIELKQPNLYVIIERYVTELGLPPKIYTFVEKLFSLSPSEFEQSENRDTNVPYYEARAMAYILFALKLLFGVNGVTEVAMSKSAKALNTFFEEHGIKCPKVFVWSEWVEYLTARKLLLMRYYEQNHLQYDNEYSDYGNRTTQHLLNLHERLLDKDYGRKVLEMDQKGTKNLLPGLRREIRLAKVTKRLAESKGEPIPIMQFPPSLTPDTTNLEVLMRNDSISVPSLLREDFRDRDIEYVIKSSKLRKKLRKCGFQLKTVEAPTNTCVTFTRSNKSETKMGNFKKVYEKFGILEMNISTDTFQKELEVESRQTLLEQMKVRDDPQVKQELSGLKQYMKEVMKKKRATYNPKSDDLFDEIETSSDSEADEGDTTTITVHRPNFEYWTYLEYPHFLTQDAYDYVSPDFPLSFKWLLENCATLIGIPALILYFELVAVETQFLYVLKPMYEVEKEVVYQDVKRLGSGMSSLVRNLRRKFKSGQWN